MILSKEKMGPPVLLDYPIWPLAIALVFVILPLITLVRVRYRRGLREIPGPFFASILPFDRIVTTFSGHQFQKHLDYHEKYGSLVRVGPNHVSIGNSDQISNVYNITSRFDKVGPPFPSSGMT